MKSAFIDFFSSSPITALATAFIILVATIYLVAKRWIGFSTAFILLLISLVAAVLINNPQIFDHYSQASFSKEIEHQDAFNKQFLQAIEGVKSEVALEKENIQQLKSQLQDIVNQLDNQKQKVENFIEETRKHFQAEKAAESTPITAENSIHLK